ncbi:MAG TPA: DinB family protein, partial [Anaerolineales bacterium]
MANFSQPMAAEFLHYNLWANLRLIDACLDLAPEQLAASAPGVYGSIYDTLVHLIKAEARYYKRLAGVSLDPPFSWEAAPSLSEIRPYAQW